MCTQIHTQTHTHTHTQPNVFLQWCVPAKGGAYEYPPIKNLFFLISGILIGLLKCKRVKKDKKTTSSSRECVLGKNVFHEKMCVCVNVPPHMMQTCQKRQHDTMFRKKNMFREKTSATREHAHERMCSPENIWDNVCLGVILMCDAELHSREKVSTRERVHKPTFVTS